MNLQSIHGTLLADMSFSDFLSSLDSELRFALLVIIIGCATAIVISLAGFAVWAMQAMHRRRLEADMKRDMLDRGMSAEEIARVVEASAPQDFLDRWALRECRKKKTA